MPHRRRFAALVLAAALLASPAAAGAQEPFAPLPTPQRTIPAPEPARDDDNDLTGTQTLLVLIAAGALLGGIAWFVVRDARSRAPVQEREGRVVRDDADARQRSSEEHRKAKARNRAAAKRAREARRKARRKSR